MASKKSKGKYTAVPDSVQQSGLVADYTAFEDINWAEPCLSVYNKWVKGGRKHSKNIATIDGKYCVAISTDAFGGKTGDYITIHLKDGTNIPAIIADVKGSDKESKWGHNRGYGGVSIVEWWTMGGIHDGPKLGSWKGKKVKGITVGSASGSTGGTVTLKGGAALVAWAKEHVGKNNPKSWYELGSSVLEGPCDCSGFVTNVYANFFDKDGFKNEINKRKSHGWYTGTYASSSRFYDIKRSELKPGDVIVAGGYHIGLYVDPKTIYHCTTPEGKDAGGGIKKKECDAKSWMSDHSAKARRYKDIDKARYTTEGEAGAENSGGTIDMKKRIAKLYSSDNYNYVPLVVQKPDRFDILVDTIKDWLTKKHRKVRKKSQTEIEDHYKVDNSNVAPKDVDFKLLYYKLDTLLTRNQPRKKAYGNNILSVGKNLVEAPFVQLEIAGKIIGTYRGESNTYPNYILSLDISKVNGELNTYKISMVYQVRAGEDPNRLDKLFSANQFNDIKIHYGDINTGRYYKEEKAVVTNITSQRDYVNNRINYILTAVSAGRRLDAITASFAAVKSKASTQLANVIYDSQYSNLILDAYPAMKDKSKVFSSGFIPTDDSVLNIMAKNNISLNEYMKYLVAVMSPQTEGGKVIRDSVYMISYYDDVNTGAGFSVKKVNKNGNFNKVNSNIFEVDINYPDDALIYNFNISTNNSWSVMYNSHVSNNAKEYFYSINRHGNIEKTYSPNITKNSSQLSEVDKNWWSYMVNFPVKASLTMRGLLQSSFLTDYIIINTYFYGIRHYTSGLYTIIGQDDILNNSGFKTTLSLVKVGGNDTI